MKLLILSFSIVSMILAEMTILADVREPGAPVTSAQSQNLQSEPGANAGVTLEDAKLAKSSMNRIRNRTAEHLIVALASVADFRYGGPGFESLGVEDNIVTISGAIHSESKVDCLRKLSQLRLELDKYHKSVKVSLQERTREGVRFTLKLHDAADFINCLASQETNQVTTPSQQKLAGQLWRKAEEEKQTAEKLFSQNDYGAAEKAYERAEELFASVMSLGDARSIQHIVEMHDSLAALKSELEMLQIVGLPDTIVFKGGREMKCEVVTETPDSIRIRMESGTAVISRTQIDSVDNVSRESKQKQQKLKSEIQAIQKQQKDIGLILEDLHQGLRALLHDSSGDSA
jgi:hypothetical protein